MIDRSVIITMVLVAIGTAIQVAPHFQETIGLTGVALIAVVAGAAFVGLYLLFALAALQQAMRQKLKKTRPKAIVEKRLGKDIQLLRQSDRTRVKSWMVPFIPGRMDGVQRLKLKLEAAGYPAENAIEKFVSRRLIFGVGNAFSVGSLGAMLGGPLASIPAGAVGGYLGWVIVHSSLATKARKRGEKIGEGMADAVDVLAIYIAAGVPLDAALDKAIPDLEKIAPPLAIELRRLGDELRTTQNRQAAFDLFLARNDSGPVREFAGIVKQADRDGTPMSSALERLALSLRSDRRRAVERKAEAMVVKLVGPQFFFAIPAFLLSMMFSPGYEAFQQFSEVF